MCTIEALLAKYDLNYIMCGGDMNTYFSRQNWNHTNFYYIFVVNLEHVGKQKPQYLIYLPSGVK